MSKAQYLLLASFIGFYGLLFAYLLVRALAGIISARFARARPATDVRAAKLKTSRAWTNGLYHERREKVLS